MTLKMLAYGSIAAKLRDLADQVTEAVMQSSRIGRSYFDDIGSGPLAW